MDQQQGSPWEKWTDQRAFTDYLRVLSDRFAFLVSLRSSRAQLFILISGGAAAGLATLYKAGGGIKIDLQNGESQDVTPMINLAVAFLLTILGCCAIIYDATNYARSYHIVVEFNKHLRSFPRCIAPEHEMKNWVKYVGEDFLFVAQIIFTTAGVAAYSVVSVYHACDEKERIPWGVPVVSFVVTIFLLYRFWYWFGRYYRDEGPQTWYPFAGRKDPALDQNSPSLRRPAS